MKNVCGAADGDDDCSQGGRPPAPRAPRPSPSPGAAPRVGASRRAQGLALAPLTLLAGLALPSPTLAQRASENAVAASDDAFGLAVGREQTGLYTDSEVRGFSPAAAGNVRIEGLYVDLQNVVSRRLLASAAIRVGLTSQGFAFPAPTGIVDLKLRWPGHEPLASVSALAGSHGAVALDVDAQTRVTDALSVGVGFGARHDEPAGGEVTELVNTALAAVWRPTPSLDVRAFAGEVRWRPKSTPILFAAGEPLPEPYRRRYWGQSWAGSKHRSALAGLVGDVDLTGAWRLKLGAFHSVSDADRVVNDLLLNAHTDGSGDRVLIAQRDQLFRSTSGEARLVGVFEGDGALREVVQLSVRGRWQRGDFGGTDTVFLGRGQAGEAGDAAEPAFAFPSLSHQAVDQASVGATYEAYWRRRAQLVLGLQKARYRKVVMSPGAAEARTRDDPWLYNAAGAVSLGEDLMAYAGYTSGLEENGTAPQNAVNFPEVLPAIRTRQQDGGLRWTVRRGLNVVLGAFEVRKPYYNLDDGRRYVELGDLVNRGVEISVAGPLTPAWRVVAGAIVSDPQAHIRAATLARIGDRPVGIPSRLIRLSTDYRLPAHPALSLDATVTVLGRRPVNTANTVYAPGVTTLDLGARYRFHIDKAPATLRLQLQNVGDAWGWTVLNAGGALQPLPPRRATLTLTADF